MKSMPTVGVVIATYQRPDLLRKAVASVLRQDYAGEVHVMVVFDRGDPDPALKQTSPGRRVSVLTNSRTAGLAGSRNTGILALTTELVAFCDDDDIWLDGKLAAQVDRLASKPDAQFSTTAMVVETASRDVTRTAGLSEVALKSLVRSRMTMLHSSSFLFKRAAMLNGFGLVSEAIPQSMAEDWDLLLRAAKGRPIVHVDEPLIRVKWGPSSFFNEAWRAKNAAHQWLLDNHEEIRRDPAGRALQYGKLSFGHAVLGERRAACRAAWRSMRANWREPRGPIALTVVAGMPGGWVQRKLNDRGHGV